MSETTREEQEGQWCELTRNLFGKHPTGCLSQQVFRAWINCLPYAAVELLLLRGAEESVEVFMQRRNDEEFPSCWAPTGSVVLPGESLEQKLEFIRLNELGGVTVSAPQMIGVTSVRRSDGRRQHSDNRIYICWLREPWTERLATETAGRFFPLDNPPGEARHLEYWEMLIKWLKFQRWLAHIERLKACVPPDGCIPPIIFETHT
jgi:ADP-ribose pyrophosphatase YjhB (NUDIX family)